ncbi:penicillin-binding protein 2 [Petroclostridium sp. X23]|uniref:penicillin-binding protein 2 n=1 Tax=Petroclostridium sp. X23 TaxID=3045146 RepID=UPI0024ADE091|nr:penicillin-binding protein 2 [Petroclostridium sp. X23]WHH59950.1 penicillin-binding protein 2 [Petroclostridium sp. X23]
MKSRYSILGIFIIIVGVIFIYRLLQLQIVDGANYAKQSKSRLKRTIQVKAPRGEIMDRYGRTIATNRVGYSLVIQKTNISVNELNDMILKLATLLERSQDMYVDILPITIPPFEFNFSGNDENSKNEKAIEWKTERNFDVDDTAEEVIQSLRQVYKIPESYSDLEARKVISIRYAMAEQGFGIFNGFNIASDVSVNTIMQLEERNNEFPGIGIFQEPIRSYPQQQLAAHLLGYVGRINAEEYAKLKEKGYGMNDTLGKAGLEKYLEEYLKGQDSQRQIEMDQSGQLTQVLNSSVPIPGNNVLLTIDSEVQRVAEMSLQNVIEKIRSGGYGEKYSDANSGSVVALDVNTGAVIAMASYPTYDPSSFYKDYQRLANDELQPLFNRAISGAYAPGSTFKMLTGIAALEEGIVTSQDKILDTGLYRFYKGYQPACWLWTRSRSTHGYLDMVGALKVSCNIYFYDVGRRLGIDRLYNYGLKFGLGQMTGIELTGESKGILAGPETRKQIFNAPWNPGDTIQAAIGQSDNVFTPLQIANYISTIANGGTRYKVHLVDKVKSADGKVLKAVEPEILEKISLKPETIKTIFEGMKAVTQPGGTASAPFNNFPVTVAGKTGTAQVPNGSDNGVFVAFAPYENPQIAVAVIVEHGGSGGNVAPVARDIIAAYLGLDKTESSDFPQNQLIR